MNMPIRTVWLVLLASMILVVSSAEDATAQRRYAVIVGINEYEDPSSFGNLETCVADSIAMYDTLTKNCGYDADNVLLINDWGGTEKPENLSLEDFRKLQQRLPTSTNLRQRIPRWLALAKPEDTVMVFFSGHGILFEGDGVLATSDCRLADADRSGLPTAELQEMLQVCAAERKVLVLDCCHAGAAADKSGGQNTSSEELATIFQRAKGLVTLASCGQNEKSQQDPKKGLSLFTYFLTLGLKGEADVNNSGEPGFGVVDHVELHSYVSYQVQKTMAQVYSNVEQTPKLFDEDSKGLFALARVKRTAPTTDREFIGNNLNNAAPPKPGQAAEEAFVRLQNQRTNDPVEEVKILVAEAIKLRQPIIKSATPTPTTRNPFYNDDRTNTVFEWLSTASNASQQSGSRLERNLELSLKTSQALAAWYKPARDTALARKLVDELYPFDQSSDMRDVRAQLFLLHAETRDSSRAGQIAALDSYSRILTLAREHELAAGEEMSPVELRQDVVNQALAVTTDLGQPADAKVRAQLAAMHGAFGELVDRNPLLFPRDKAIAKSNLEKAISLDSDAPEYPRSLASILLQMPKPDYARVRDLAETTLAKSRGSLDTLIAHRLVGQAWLDGSRRLTDVSKRKSDVDQAINAFSSAVDAYQRDFANKENVSKLAAKHYVDSLVQRADAFKDQANFLLDFRGNGRGEALDKAIADARKATEIDNERLQHRAWKALGNALEDSAWLAGRTENYAEAAEAFRTAAKKNQLSAQAHVDLARCLIKWETEGGERGHLSEAKAELEYVINDLYESLPRAHAKFWLAKIHMHLGQDLAAADEALREAWEGMKNDPDVNEYNLGICVENRAKLNLQRAAKLIAKPGTLSAKDIQEARLYLGFADFSAGELAKFSRPKAAGLEADVVIKESQILENQGQSAQARTKLNEAMAKFAEHLNAAELTDRERCEILLGRCSLIMGTSLREEDVSKATPQALADANEAAELASTEVHFAAAKGWAGYILYENCFARRVSPNDLDSNPIYSKAISDLEEAIQLAPKHQSAGRWYLTAGSILYIKTAVTRSKGQEIPIELSQQADKYLELAAATDASLKGEVQTLRANLRRADPRLDG
ncbi:MAG: caspase family protein [Pirellulales bacterium]|nr:caspase family protein [Pirellulales bacterium]